MNRKKNIKLKKEAALIKTRRCTLARLHFRAAIRLVYKNNYWLDDTEGEQLGMNVAKNIQILTRKKPKGKFTLTEKAIMKVPQEKRTEAEKQLLRRKLGVMKCFRKYPAEVKQELAAITYFSEYEADRTIVRQGDEALGLYFVVSGTARVLIKAYDPLADQVTEINVKVKEEGDIFGELALLVGSKRTATIITNERSEFLNVKRQDFDRVLKGTVQKEWDEIRRSLGLFDYFKKWDERNVIESCMLSKMRYYDEQSLILSEDHGDKRYVYFLIEGSIDILECLEMKVTTFKNKRTYTLANTLDNEYTGRRKTFTEDLEKLLGTKRPETEKGASEPTLRSNQSRPVSIDTIGFQEPVSASKLKLTESMWKVKKKRPSIFRKSFQPTMPQSMTEMSPAARVSCVKQFESRLSRVTCMKEGPVTTIETYFIRVAKMAALSTFNIGEPLDSRYYVTKSKVKLLAIPRYWLLSSNKPLWNNLLILLKTRLPNRLQLYEQFVKHRKWLAYRKECFYDIASRTRKSNINSINNVPLSIRLKEDTEYYICRKQLLSRMSSMSSDRNKDSRRNSSTCKKINQ